ncbi:hypothetical protein G6F58_013470 [Rhizopus delemar]|nr:hypothetical protein G6F58_013470 [Rhizopus delemar]
MNWRFNDDNALRAALGYYDFKNISGRLSSPCALYAEGQHPDADPRHRAQSAGPGQHAHAAVRRPGLGVPPGHAEPALGYAAGAGHRPAPGR